MLFEYAEWFFGTVLCTAGRSGEFSPVTLDLCTGAHWDIISVGFKYLSKADVFYLWNFL
jgi:hypothetical protein